jgi:hypothetical protein
LEVSQTTFEDTFRDKNKKSPNFAIENRKHLACNFNRISNYNAGAFVLDSGHSKVVAKKEDSKKPWTIYPEKKEYLNGLTLKQIDALSKGITSHRVKPEKPVVVVKQQ